VLADLVLLQVAVPVALIAVHAVLPAASRTGLALRMAAILVLLTYAALAGLWLFPPWWTPYVLAVLHFAASWRLYRRLVHRGETARRIEIAGGAAALIGAAALLWPAFSGQRPPQVVIDLAMPLGPGRYLVVSGGAHPALNAHYLTLDLDRAAAYRGQSHAVDLIAIGPLGLRAKGILPADPAAYDIYGRDVLAPCSGRVIAVRDGVPDNKVPRMNRNAMTGNSAILDCNGLGVVLAHFIPGSLRIAPGDIVTIGQTIAKVGNSGNSGEPHLHVHVQTLAGPEEPLSGDPLFFTLDGRFPVRNARLIVNDG
jgi:hypothetical protein